MPRKKKEEPQAGQVLEGQAQAMTLKVSALREALELVAPAVPSKSALPITTYVRLGGGRVVATDLEVAVAVRLPEADADILLPHKDALVFLKYVPGHLDAHVEVNRGKASIVAGGMVIYFKGEDPREFPPVPLPDPEGMPHQGVVDGDALVKALTTVLPYAATAQDRPLLTGVCLTLGEQLKVAAGDGFRLAWETVPGRLSGEGNIILPAGAIRALEHLWKRAATPDLTHASTPAAIALAKRLIRLGWQEDRLQMGFGPVTLVARPIAGKFPDYEQLIPTEHSSSVTLDATDMLRALQQVQHLAKKGGGIVRLVWGEGSLRVSARAEDVGDIAVSLRAASTAPGRVALNISYPLAYFKGRDGMVTMSPSTEGGPVTFSYRDTPHVVIMPMYVQWGDEPPAQAKVPPEQVEDTETRDA